MAVALVGGIHAPLGTCLVAKVLLNKILKAALWNQSSNFAKFYLRDMSQQAAISSHFGPIVVVQKVVGVQENRALET